MSKPPRQSVPFVLSPGVTLVSISRALVVAEHLSFGRAARILGIRQSTVSRHVRALEDELGVSLFERDARGVRLTEAGSRFFDRARAGVIEIDHAVKAAATAGRGTEGVLRIGIMSSVSEGFLRNLLREFHRAHRAVAVHVTESSAQEHMAKITGRQLDVAFVTSVPSAAHMDAMVLWQAPIYAALPEQHKLTGAEAVDWDSLKGEHFIVSRDAPGPEIHDYIVRRTAELGHSPSVERFEVSRETLILLVGLCFGISLVSKPATATRYPNVVFRPLATPEDVLPYSAIWLPGNDNPALRRFLSLARSLSQSRAVPRTPEPLA